MQDRELEKRDIKENEVSKLITDEGNEKKERQRAGGV